MQSIYFWCLACIIGINQSFRSEDFKTVLVTVLKLPEHTAQQLVHQMVGKGRVAIPIDPDNMTSIPQATVRMLRMEDIAAGIAEGEIRRLAL